MDKQSRDLLRQAGIDVDDALGRFMGNEGLLARFLGQFPDDPNYRALVEAVAGGDRAGALTAAHTLKGLCDNLSMTVLYDLFTQQVALLRAEDWQGACALMPGISAAYRTAVDAIGSTLG